MSLTKTGLDYIVNVLGGVEAPLSHNNVVLAVGDGATAFNAAQTKLVGNNTYSKVLDAGFPLVDTPSITFKATFNTDEANFAWNEWGIVNKDNGVLLNRVVQSNGTKLRNQTWVLEVTLEFTT